MVLGFFVGFLWGFVCLVWFGLFVFFSLVCELFLSYFARGNLIFSSSPFLIFWISVGVSVLLPSSLIEGVTCEIHGWHFYLAETIFMWLYTFLRAVTLFT